MNMPGFFSIIRYRTSSSQDLLPATLLPGVRLGRLQTDLMCLLLLALLMFCQTDEASAEKAKMPPVQVKAAQPLSQDVSEWDTFTGRITAINAVDVRAKVSGYLEQINFTAGQRVNKGDLLFVIDPKLFQAQLKLAEAELEREQTRLELAQNDFKRAKKLLKAKAISAEEYDSRSKGVREAVAAVHSAEANVYAASVNLEYCQVRAPIDGRIGRELVTLGNLVNGGGSATLLTTIVSTNPVYALIDADERSILKYKRQQTQANGQIDIEAQLSLADETGYPHLGRINYIAPQADSATGTIKLRGVFDNPEQLLSPGFFARVRIRAGAPYLALLLPDKALGTDQAQRFVWVVGKDNQVEYRKVEVGVLIGDMRVIEQGVTAEDWVVIEGLLKIRPGATVAPERVTLNKAQ